MIKYHFTAYALTKEFDLNLIAQHFKINRKFKWEDQLILKDTQLKEFLGDISEHQFAYVYSFGSIVFVNIDTPEIKSAVSFFEKSFNISKNHFTTKFIDEYELEVDPEKTLEVTNNNAICPDDNKQYMNIISLILAKSVALEKIENGINNVMDEVEDIIDYLEKGRLNIKNEPLAKLASKILGFKHRSISYIMIFDKPDITWEDIKLDDFYYQLSELFELQDRYDQMRDKIEILTDITGVFTNLTHEHRATRLEWIIIILIAIEFVIGLIDLIFK